MVFLHGRCEISVEDDDNKGEERFVETFEEVYGTRGEAREEHVFAANLRVLLD